MNKQIKKLVESIFDDEDFIKNEDELDINKSVFDTLQPGDILSYDRKIGFNNIELSTPIGYVCSTDKDTHDGYIRVIALDKLYKKDTNSLTHYTGYELTNEHSQDLEYLDGKELYKDLIAGEQRCYEDYEKFMGRTPTKFTSLIKGPSNYSTKGTKKGDWYLGSAKEYSIGYNNLSGKGIKLHTTWTSTYAGHNKSLNECQLYVVADYGKEIKVLPIVIEYNNYPCNIVPMLRLTRENF